jgi:hypothetical protein
MTEAFSVVFLQTGKAQADCRLSRRWVEEWLCRGLLVPPTRRDDGDSDLHSTAGQRQRGGVGGGRG